MQEVIEKKQWRLKVWDFVQGAILAVAIPALTVIVQSLETGSLDIDWVQVGTVSFSTLVAYLAKNLVDKDKIVIKDPNQTTSQMVSRVIR